MELRGRPIRPKPIDCYCYYCGKTLDWDGLSEIYHACPKCNRDYQKNKRKGKPDKYINPEHEWWKKNRHLLKGN